MNKVYYYMLPLDGNNKNVYEQIDNTMVQELFILNNEQKKLLIQECKKKVESFKSSLLDLSGCLNDCLKWGDETFYKEAEENFNVCLRKLKEAKQIIEGIF